MYKQKYIKYKQKYIFYKNQKGGNYTITNTQELKVIFEIIPGYNSNKYPNSKCYLFYKDTDLIGYAFLQKPNKDIVHPVLKEFPDNKIFVWGVEILPEFQGKGLGYQMMRMILKENKNYFLRVNKENIPAVKLYKKLGFSVYREEEIKVDDK